MPLRLVEIVRARDDSAAFAELVLCDGVVEGFIWITLFRVSIPLNISGYDPHFS